MQNAAQNKGSRYEPPHYACTGSMIPMQNIQPQYGQHHHQQHHQLAPQQQLHHHHFHNHHQKPQHQSVSLHRKVPPPIPSARAYMKPLPKLPPNIGKFLVFYF